MIPHKDFLRSPVNQAFGAIVSVRVGGASVLVSEGTMEIPDLV